MYQGPDPKTVNLNYPNHTHELITCLINGEQKRIIQDRYLRKFGYTKETYLAKFVDAPLKSLAASESYRQAALNDGGMRARNMTRLNAEGPDGDFQKNRRKSRREFLDSDDSKEYRKYLSDKAKKQHDGQGLSDAVRAYFNERYQGSEHQEKKREAFLADNPVYREGVVDKARETYIRNHEAGLHDDPKGTKKKQYKDTSLTYQSSYELDFLEYCESRGIIHLVQNAKTLRDNLYPRRYYLPDYIIAESTVVEVKSWYIQKLGEEKFGPAHLDEKRALVERKGFQWLYLLDKDYTELNALLNILE
jgi:hypothetical protein